MASRKSNFIQQQNAVRQIQQAQQRTTGDGVLPSHSRQTSATDLPTVTSTVIPSPMSYPTGPPLPPISAGSSDNPAIAERKIRTVCFAPFSWTEADCRFCVVGSATSST